MFMLPTLNQILRFVLLINTLRMFSSRINRRNSRDETDNIEMEIYNGRIRGVQKLSRDGQKAYYYFRGIPYAQQPVGELRFEPPIPAKSWKPSVLDATRYGPFCVQIHNVNFGFIQSESCLFLNVAVPKGALPRRNEYNEPNPAIYPVIVNIPGGGFIAGASNGYDPSYFMDEDVVFVSLNYRIGVFGFLNTGDDVVRGNMGLKDQTMALKWVQQNIAYFGGDPNSVTLLGQSSGGTCVHLHLFAPMSTGLFHRAISESGVAMDLNLLNNPRDRGINLARKLRCPTNNTREMVACLKSIPLKRINRLDKSDFRNSMDQFHTGSGLGFGPSLEAVYDSNTFIFDTPNNLIRQGIVPDLSSIPWIVGLNANELLPAAMLALQFRRIVNASNREWKRYAPLVLGYNDHPNKDNISTLIRRQYLGDRKVSVKTAPETALIASDRYFARPIHDTIRSHAWMQPMYAYYFTYKAKPTFANFASKFAMLPPFLPKSLGVMYASARDRVKNLFKIETDRSDPGHSDEMPLFFQMCSASRPVMQDHDDFPMSRELVRVWTNFARTGKPGGMFGVEWERVEMNDQERVKYFKIDSNPMMIDEPFTSRVAFWKSLRLDEDVYNDAYDHDVNS